MASNFKIMAHRNSENLHLRLSGDFDGSSALQLIHWLRKYSNNTCKVFVHTGNIRTIYAFGSDTLQKNLSDFRNCHIQLYFTGDNAGKIAGEECFFG